MSRKRKQDRYRAAVIKSDLSATSKLVALVLAERMDYSTLASAYGGVPSLTRETGLSERTVHNHLRILEDEGWIRCTHQGGGRGNASIYQGLIPGEDRSKVTTTTRAKTSTRATTSVNGPKTVRWWDELERDPFYPWDEAPPLIREGNGYQVTEYARELLMYDLDTLTMYHSGRLYNTIRTNLELSIRDPSVQRAMMNRLPGITDPVELLDESLIEARQLLRYWFKIPVDCRYDDSEYPEDPPKFPDDQTYRRLCGAIKHFGPWWREETPFYTADVGDDPETVEDYFWATL